MEIAYTIGAVCSYDQLLAGTEPVYKVGACPNECPPYEGGCVWHTAQDAARHIAECGVLLGFEAAVYEVQLPTSWEVDVTSFPSPFGLYHLINDARILSKIAL